MKYKVLIIAILISFWDLSIFAQPLAFPGAEGFGRFASGGRGGEVYLVTNLNDSGSGSFRDAVSEPNRIIVFRIGGVIEIESRIVVASNVTIAGQTAPGDGITIYGNGLSYSKANNTITRYIRIRMGRIGDKGKDAITIASGHDMIFDHISVTWGRDGTFDINGNVSNITIQNSIIGQGLQNHSTGGLMQSEGGISVLRCLYIDNHTRNPKVKGINQYVNNVVYNWAVAGYILGDSERHSEANVRNNYFIAGPETNSAPFNRANQNFHLYAENNWFDGNRNGMLDGSEIKRNVYGPVSWVDEPFDFPSVTLMSPNEAYDWIVDNVGPSLNRDHVDQFLIDELTSLGQKGKMISNELNLPTKGPGEHKSGTPPEDTDHDGMADKWELENKLDPNEKADFNEINEKGYTNLEVYINQLVE